MKKQDAIKDAVKYFDMYPTCTIFVLRRGLVYKASQHELKGWKVSEMISAGNVQNYRAQPTTGAAREHLPTCGFLKSGKDQTACNCAALLSAMDERSEAEHTNRIYRSSMEEIGRLRSDAVSNGWRVGPIWGSGGRYYFDFTPIADAPARMTFKLEIRLGNDAMRTQQDVRAAILKTFSVEDAPITLHAGDAQRVTDANGNNVGQWEVSADAPASDGSKEPLKHFYHP